MALNLDSLSARDLADLAALKREAERREGEKRVADPWGPTIKAYRTKPWLAASMDRFRGWSAWDLIQAGRDCAEAGLAVGVLADIAALSELGPKVLAKAVAAYQEGSRCGPTS